MIPRIPGDPVLRERRKADLLLASQLLRGQVVLTADDLGERADLWGRRLLALRAWAANPWVLAGGGAAAALFAGAGRRRSSLLRGLRWGWLVWRLWRLWRQPR